MPHNLRPARKLRGVAAAAAAGVVAAGAAGVAAGAVAAAEEAAAGPGASVAGVRPKTLSRRRSTLITGAGSC